MIYVSYHLTIELQKLRLALQDCSPLDNCRKLSKLLKEYAHPPLEVYCWFLHQSMRASMQSQVVSENILDISIGGLKDSLKDAVNSGGNWFPLATATRSSLMIYLDQVKDIRQSLPGVCSSRSSIDLLNEGLSLIVSELDRCSINIDSERLLGRGEDVLHVVGESGFFSEIERLVALLCYCEKGGRSLSVGFSLESPYRESIFFNSLLKTFNISTIRSPQDVRMSNGKGVEDVLRHLSTMHDSGGVLTELEIIKSKVYKRILLCFEDVYSHTSTLDNFSKDAFSYISKGFTIFDRGGDKKFRETVPMSAGQLMTSIYNTYESLYFTRRGWLNYLSDSSLRIETISSQFSLVKSWRESCDHESSEGYNNSKFLRGEVHKRADMERRIVGNYLALAHSKRFTGEPLSNLVNAAIYTCPNKYVSLPGWEAHNAFLL